MATTDKCNGAIIPEDDSYVFNSTSLLEVTYIKIKIE